MAALIEVKYFNSFILRKTLNASTGGTAVWNGARSNNTYPKTATSSDMNWAVEESRIRGGYNNVSSDYGAKAYIVDDNPNASVRVNSLIYSGIFNARTNINNTNVFSVGEDITKSVDPINGSIQKIYADNSWLQIFQEKKVSRAPIDRDLIYSAEGSPILTASDKVIGTIDPYAGNFGISKNPESFSVYGNRKYFTDRDRNAVLRLSNNGITEISNYGMIDFFRDEFGALGNGKLVGGWDIYNKQYSLSIQPHFIGLQSAEPYSTLSFDEAINGWPSFYSYKPVSQISLKSNFYSAGPSLDSDDGGFTGANGPNTSGLYQHYISSQPRGTFYGISTPSSIEFIFNPNVSISKVFKTINYEGSNGWQVTDLRSDLTGQNASITPAGGWLSNFDQATGNVRLADGTASAFSYTEIYSYDEGLYSEGGIDYRAGFNRKQNKYYAVIPNNTQTEMAGEVIFGNQTMGIKGYYATVTMTTDSTTNNGGLKSLFAVSSEFIQK